MRSATQAQRNALRGADVAYSTMVWVERSGAWQNMNTLGGIDWVSDVEVETSVDQPIWTATVRLLRETHPTQSLAPLMGVSDLNKLNGAISQALWVGRRVRVFVSAQTSTYAPAPPPPDPPPPSAENQITAPVTSRTVRRAGTGLGTVIENAAGALIGTPMTSRTRRAAGPGLAGAIEGVDLIAAPMTSRTVRRAGAGLGTIVEGADLTVEPMTSRTVRRAGGGLGTVVESAGGASVGTASVGTASFVDAHPGEDWVEIFHGFIQELEWGGSDEIVLHAHDLGARLLAATMLTEITIANMTLDEAIPHVLQNSGVATPLYVPVLPDYMITRVELPRTNVMEAIRSLAHANGWEVRYRYDANQVSRLTLYEAYTQDNPTMQSFSADDYREIRRLNVSLAPVRTVVRINFNNRETSSESHVTSPTLDAINTASPTSPVGRYGIRLYERTFGTESNIRTRQEATKLADIIRRDIQEVYADKEVEMWLWWPAEPGDNYLFAGNNVHYDSPQAHSVVAIRHRLASGEGWTSLTTRGTPVVLYRTWLRDDDGPRGKSTPPSINEVRLADLNLPGGKVVQVTVSISRTVAQWKMWARKDAWPTTNGQQYASPSDDYLRIFGTRDNLQARIAAKADETWYVIAVGYNDEGVEGAPAFSQITTETGDPVGGAVGVLYNIGHYFNLGADGWGSIALTWNHNQAIQDSGAGEYVMEIRRGLNETLRASRSPTLEENGMDNIVDYGAWFDNLYVRQTPPPPNESAVEKLPDSDEDGTFHDVTYKLVLRRNGAVVQTDYHSVRLWTADEV
jgi:hypothetical protein